MIIKQNYIFLKFLYVLIFICFSLSSLSVNSAQHSNNSVVELHKAITNGYQSKIKTLLNNKNTSLESRDRFNRTPIHISTEKQDIKTTKRLINKGVNVNVQDIQGMTIAHIAAKLKNIPLLEFILDANPNLDLINNMGRNAFLTGVHEGHIDVVQTFVNHQPELLNSTDVNGMTGVQIASKAKKISMLKALKKLEADTPEIKNCRKAF